MERIYRRRSFIRMFMWMFFWISLDNNGNSRWYNFHLSVIKKFSYCCRTDFRNIRKGDNIAYAKENTKNY